MVPDQKVDFYLKSQDESIQAAAVNVFSSAIEELGKTTSAKVLKLALQSAAASVANSADQEYKNAVDPADPAYTQIPEVEPLRIAELEDLPGSVWRRFATTTVRADALTRAEATARDRAVAARLAGDRLWESRQLIAAADFGLRGVTLQMETIGLQQLIQPFFEESLMPLVDDALSNLRAEGLSELEVRILGRFGWTSEQIDTWQSNAAFIGEDYLDDPGILLWTQRMAALLSSNVAMADLRTAIEIRAELPGMEVRGPTVEERGALGDLRSAVEGRFGDRAADRAIAWQDRFLPR